MDTFDPSVGAFLGMAMGGGAALVWSAWRWRNTSELKAARQLKELHLLLEHAAEGILRVDASGKLIGAHDQWARRLGLRQKEILGKHWRELIHPEDAGRLDATLAKVSDDPLEVEVRTWRKDGRENYQRLTIFQSRDEQGRRDGYEWLCKDITQSKRTEESLRLQKALFQAVSEASVEGILVLSADGRLICFNQRLREMFTPDESTLQIGEPGDRLLCEIFQRTTNVEVSKATFNRVGHDSQARDGGEMRLRNGRVLQQFSAPLSGEGLCVSGRAWFFRDITDKERVTEELLQARDSADAANRAKSTFLANVSHEIRTPMTAVLGYAELMMARCEKIDSQLALWAQTIHRGAHRLVQLMNEILELSKIEAGRMAIVPAVCRTADLVQEVLELFKHQANDQHIVLEAEFAASTPEKLYTDPNRVRQILTNLVGNAIKFTSRGSVRVEVSGVGERLCVDVIDTGMGINQQEQSQLFEPFSRGDNATQCAGVGLGLAISRRLARLLGGDIQYHSTEGVGSQFTLILESRLMEEFSREDAPQIPTQATRSIEGARVLIADDIPMLREFVCTILSEAGACVDCAEDGLSAVQAVRNAMAERKAFDVILMDMHMPIMDGYAATRQLRREGYTGGIIALTASAMEEDRIRCIEAGCDDFESKPPDRVMLIERIANCIARRHERAA